MKLSEIELDFLYEKSAELFRDKVKQRGEDYEHDNRCACPEAVHRTHLRTLAMECTTVPKDGNDFIILWEGRMARITHWKPIKKLED